MANLNTPFGGRSLNTLVAADFNSKTHIYHTSTGDATALFVGDFVKLTGLTTPEGIPYITQASATDTQLLGVVVGINNVFTNESQLYRTAYTDLAIEVLDDPLAEFEIQVNGTVTTSYIGKTANLIVGSGSTFTGMSGMQVNVSTIGTGNQVKLIGILPRTDNVLGLYSKVRCQIVAPAFMPAVDLINVGTTAYASGGQTNATPVNGKIIQVSTVATTADSFKIRAAKNGDWLIFRNDGANACYVYPQVGEYMAGSLNGYTSVAASTTVLFNCVADGYWTGFVI